MERVLPQGRVLYLDLLRIFCIFSMMLLHVSAIPWYSVPVSSFAWQVLNVYDSSVRFCVPVFVMISGVFFLDPNRNVTINKLFSKNILRIATAFLFWSACYAGLKNIFKYRAVHATMLSSLLKDFLMGHYHLWFLFTLVGLYLIVPFLRKICESKRLMQYYLLLSFVFAWLMPLLQKIPAFGSWLSTLVGQANLNFFLGYSGYFVLGSYLYRYPLSGRARKGAFALGGVSVLFTICATYVVSLRQGAPTGQFYDFPLINTCLASIAVFVFFQHKVSRLSFSAQAVQKILLLSKLSFGMYLVHEFINILCKEFLHFTALSFFPVLSVPVIAALVFAVSFCMIYPISKIPVLNRYIL